jgi:predicted glycoside hydrolase/deacetylase ChbG (UPF0249 family)
MDSIAPGRDRRLIVTADDFGAADCIDNAIRSAIRIGQVSAVSALTNYPRAVTALADLHEEFPDVDIGVHLNITSGPPRTDPTALATILAETGEFRGLSALMDRLGHIRMDAVETELRAQIDVLMSIGITPDHLSSHHNILAIYPPFQDLLIRLARAYALPIRKPVAISQTHTRRFGYAKTRQRANRSILGLIYRRPYRAIRLLPGTYVRLLQSRRLLIRENVQAPDHLIDSLYGGASVHNIRHILRHLPSGISELVVHLGECDSVDELPPGIETELLQDRTIERNLILNGTLRIMMDRENIRPARFKDLVDAHRG